MINIATSRKDYPSRGLPGRSKGVSGILAGVMLFAMLFSVGVGFYVYINQTNNSINHANANQQNVIQQSSLENLTLSATANSGAVTVTATNRGGVATSLLTTFVDNSNGVLQNQPVSVPAQPTLNVGQTASFVVPGYTYSSGSITVSVITGRGNTFTAQYPPPPTGTQTNVVVNSQTTTVIATVSGGGSNALVVVMTATPPVTFNCANGCVADSITVYNYALSSVTGVALNPSPPSVVVCGTGNTPGCTASLTSPVCAGPTLSNGQPDTSDSIAAYSGTGNAPYVTFQCTYNANTGAVGGFASFSGEATGVLTVTGQQVASATATSNTIEIGGQANVITQGAFTANFLFYKFSACQTPPHELSGGTYPTYSYTGVTTGTYPCNPTPTQITTPGTMNDGLLNDAFLLYSAGNYYVAYYVSLTNDFNQTLPILQYSYLYMDPGISGEQYYFLAGAATDYYNSATKTYSSYYPNYNVANSVPTLDAYSATTTSCAEVYNPLYQNYTVPSPSTCINIHPGQTLTLTFAACGWDASTWDWGGTAYANSFDSPATNCNINSVPGYGGNVPEGQVVSIEITYMYKNQAYSQLLPFDGQFILNQYIPSVSTQLSSPTIQAGQSVTDSATLSSASSFAGGTVQYEYFSSSTCSGSPTNVGSTVTVTDGVVPNSPAQTFSAAGSYGWEAVYSGDTQDAGATSPCEPLTVTKATPTISTALGQAPAATLGLDPNSASYGIVHGGSGSTSVQLKISTTNPGDVVYACEYTETTGLTFSISDTSSLTWNMRGTVTSASGGEMECWYAVSSGALSSDTITFSAPGNSAGLNAEVFSVSGANTVSPFDPNLGSAVSAVSTSSGTSSTVSITTTNGNDLIVGMVGLSGLSSGNSISAGNSFTLLDSTVHSSATMADEYQSVSTAQSGLGVGFTWSSSSAWVTMADAFAAPSSGSSGSSSTITLGSSIWDTATLSGASIPTGTVTFQVYSNSACTGAPVFTSANSISGSSATSGSFTPASAGTYYWEASYPGDSNNNGASSSCGANGEVLTVNPALVAPVISVSPPAIDSGQSSTLTTTTSLSGGTSPYTCQWLEEAPGASSYSNLGSSFTTGCTTSGLPTISTGVLSATGSWHFELQVSDSGGATKTSNAVTVTVNAALAAPTVSASTGTLDQGQSSSLTSTAVTTGTSPYTYQWLEEAPGATSYSSIPGATSSSYSFSTSTSTATGNWLFELQVTDSGSPAEVVTSNSVTVTVYSLPTVTASANPSTIDSGQTSALSASASGGSGGYTYAWYSGSSCTGTVVGTSSSYTTPTLTNPPSTDTYCVQVKDSLGSIASTTVTVNVNAVFSVTASANPSTIHSGSTSQLTATASGGSGGYTYAWYSGSCPPTGSSLSSANPYTTPALTSTTTYCVQAKDSLGSTTTASVTVSVQYQVQFAQSGLGSTATGTVVTVNGNAETYSALPYTIWVTSGQQVTFTWASTVSSSASGTQFLLSSSSQSSPYTVTSAVTITGTYTTQYQVTMAVSPSGAGTTSPSVGTAWENAGSLSISATANSGHIFSSWSSSTGSITITSSTSASTTATISGPGTITANFVVGYTATFDAPVVRTAGDVSSSTTVLTVTIGGTGTSCTGGTATNVPQSALPDSFSIATGTDVCYSYSTPIASTSGNDQYVWSSTAGTGSASSVTTQSGSFTITATSAVTATYVVQYKVTISDSGIGSDTTATVATITVGGSGSTCTLGAKTSLTQSQLPYTTGYIGTGTDICYSFSSPVPTTASTKQYVWSSTSGTGSASGATTQTGSFILSAASSVTGTYVTQYQITFAVTPSGSGSTAPSGSSVWENAGSLLISANANSGYKFSSWSSSSGSITFANPNAASTTATIGASGTITAQFASTLAIDSACEAFGSASGSKTITTQSMACAANDVIIVFVTGASSSSVSSITDSLTTHLTYTARCNTCDQHGSESIEEWYAITGSSSATFTITVTMSASGTYDVYAFGISGASTTTPFDTNTGLPANGHNMNSGTPSVSPVSTSDTNDMIIGLEGHASSTLETVGTAPSGLALIGSPQTANSQSLAAEYVVVNSAQSGITVNFGSTSGGAWSMLVDAVQADPPPPAAPAATLPNPNSAGLTSFEAGPLGISSLVALFAQLQTNSAEKPQLPPSDTEFFGGLAP